MKQLAFTLAEIIIVVGIMGIIAESTIPSLISNASNKAYKAALKKTVSVYTNVLREITIDNGGQIEPVKNPNIALAQITDKLKIIKKCDAGDVLNKCWNSSSIISGGAGMTSESVIYLDDGSYDAYVLADGSFVTIATNYGGDSPSIDGFCTGNEPNSTCNFDLLIDTNGIKAPNKAGQDIIMLGITRQGLASYKNFFSADVAGSPDLYTDCSTLNVGFGCEQKIMLNEL